MAIVTRVIAEPWDNFGEQVKKYKSFSRKEKQIWAIREKKDKGKKEQQKKARLNPKEKRKLKKDKKNL